MVSRTKSQYLSVSGEWDERKPPVNSPNIDREDVNLKSCRIEANENGHSQGKDKNWTESQSETGQSQQDSHMAPAFPVPALPTWEIGTNLRPPWR